MNRRSFLGGVLAAAAMATGLAQTRLELVDDERPTGRIGIDWASGPDETMIISGPVRGRWALQEAANAVANERLRIMFGHQPISWKGPPT